MPIKSAYIMTDLEGVAGIDDWDPGSRDYGTSAKGVYERSEMQRLLTGEVNAAVEGLLAAGVGEILVNDGHGAGRTILPEQLVAGARIARGTNRPSWLVGIAPRFGALFQVGMHAMSDTPNGCLCHTMAGSIKAYRINGRDVGEMEIAAYLAGELGLPWAFTAGDLHACREAEAWAPGIVTAAVKEGLGRNCAIHLAPVDARALIRERIQEAVARANDVRPLVAEPPVTMEIEHREPGPLNLGPGAERVNAFTVRWTGPSLWSVFHLATYGREVPRPQ